MGFNHLVMYQNYKNKLLDNNLESSSLKYITKKAEPLSIYITGTNDLIDRTLMFDSEKDTYILDLQGINFNAFRQYFPLIDFNYLVRVILSFLAMIIGFDAFCGEKQNGTMKLILSNSIPRGTILWGKLLGNFLTLAIPFVFASLFYFIILTFKHDVHFTLLDNIRLLLMMLASLIYLAIFLIISLAVSASSSTAVISIIKNFIIWVTIIFFIPTFSPLLSNYSAKLPDGRKIGDTYLINLMENNNQIPDSLVREKAFYKYTSNVLDYRNKLKKQVRTIELTALIIPSNAFNLCVTSLTMCGLEDEEHFRSSILKYHIECFNGETSHEFTYEGLNLKSSFLICIKYYVSLLIFMLAMYIIAVNRFKFYDVR
jgi:ABC-type transport system involved in multi-copper enzyme maturation permease subunit